MKKVLFLSAVIVLLLAACKKEKTEFEEIAQTEETETLSEDRAAPERIAICHVNPQGTVSLKFVHPNNLQNHLEHGDQLATAYYADNDGDGYGAGAPQYGCSPIEGLVDQDGDCDDTNPAVYPGAAETCDGIDNDCNGQADDGLPTTTYYEDADGDGYGLNESTFTGCSQPAGYVAQGGDCNDNDASVHPGATEICGDGIDQDCDGSDPSCVTCPVFTTADLHDLLTFNPDYGWWVYESTCNPYPYDLIQEVYLYFPVQSGPNRGSAMTNARTNAVTYSNDVLGIARGEFVTPAEFEACKITLKAFMDEMVEIYPDGPVRNKCDL